jgi:hypothetical protein
MYILLPQVRHNQILVDSQNLEYLIKPSFQWKMKKENVRQCRNKIFRFHRLVSVFITNAYFKHKIYSGTAMTINWSLDCALTILTRFAAELEGAQFLAEARDFSPKLPHQLRDLLSFLFHGYQGSSSGIKWPGQESGRLPPSSAGDKNGWSCISTPPICLHVMMRDLTFMLTVTKTHKYRKVNK